MNSSSVNHPAVYCVCITSMTHMHVGLVSPELHKFPPDFVHEQISCVKTIKNDHYHVLQHVIL